MLRIEDSGLFCACQKDKNGEEHPIAFASRKLLIREQSLSTTEKECLGIVWEVELFRYYLFGRTFKLQTNHNPLIWLNQLRDKTKKLLRWSIMLQEYAKSTPTLMPLAEY